MPKGKVEVAYLAQSFRGGIFVYAFRWVAHVQLCDSWLHDDADFLFKV